jgi:fructoselysine 6-phosphate deglycase
LTNKQIDFDSTSFINDLHTSVNLISQAEETGSSLASKEIKRLYLVGCGAPYYMFRVIAYWANLMTDGIEINNLYPAELLQLKDTLNEKTAVIFGSHSGMTAETVQAAKFLQSKPCHSIAVTEFSDSPLAKHIQEVLAYGTTKQGYFSSYIIAQMVVSAFLQKTAKDWRIHEDLKISLSNFPAALADAKEMSMTTAFSHAADLQDEKILYIIGTGPMYSTAYVFAACFLMEMQHLHAHPVNAKDFFHGPFEIVDASTPLIVLLGEGTNRTEAERVRQFCNRHTGGCITYDAKEFAMQGIHPEIRPMVAPFILDAALTNLVERLAILRGHPMDTRRYMGKVDY